MGNPPRPRAVRQHLPRVPDRLAAAAARSGGRWPGADRSRAGVWHRDQPCAVGDRWPAAPDLAGRWSGPPAGATSDTGRSVRRVLRPGRAAVPRAAAPRRASEHMGPRPPAARRCQTHRMGVCLEPRPRRRAAPRRVRGRPAPARVPRPALRDRERRRGCGPCGVLSRQHGGQAAEVDHRARRAVRPQERAAVDAGRAGEPARGAGHGCAR